MAEQILIKSIKRDILLCFTPCKPCTLQSIEKVVSRRNIARERRRLDNDYRKSLQSHS